MARSLIPVENAYYRGRYGTRREGTCQVIRTDATPFRARSYTIQRHREGRVGMTTAVQDSQTPRCLTCDYPLLSLSEHRCPECGRAFDPADPRTVRTPRSPGNIAQFLLKPPGWPLHASVATTVLLTLAAGSVPGGYFGLAFLAGALWIAVGLSWWGRGFLYSILRRKFKKDWPVRSRTSTHWLVMPLAIIITVGAIAADVPLAISFRLSRSSMDSLAKEAMNGTNPNIPDRWVGVYYVQNIETTATGMRFLVRDTGFLGRIGFAWSTTPLPTDSNDRYRHFDGPWYTWVEDW